VRRAAALAAFAVPAALLTAAVAVNAGEGRAAPSPHPGSGALITVQADVTRKARPATLPTTSHRGKRPRVTDAATPPSPGTAPAVSASSPLTAAQDGVRQSARVTVGARAPPASSGQASARDGARLS
jgi:hypothetical protein